MSEILVNTIKKADGTGSITVPATTGTLVNTSGATFTGAVTGTDLTLSGGAYIGGTGAANYLDDYEEGTWTPAYSGSSSSPTVTHNMQVGTYRKIGNMVTVIWQIRASSYSGGSGDLQVTGLPFASSTASNAQAYGTVNYEQFNLSTGRTQAVAVVYPSSNYIGFWEEGDSVDVNQPQVGALTGGLYLTRGTITYFTD